ncbi:hypothetical protein Thiowin_01950 [Thiorhodovibrio winogradskyi]|uniref:Secreted protein n=1 Tax=Thiorhodovibrio winogradskyi TaxID=77007 RepID=A0ABZ0S8M1_9GAMM
MLKLLLRQLVVIRTLAQGSAMVLLGIPRPGLFLRPHPLYDELADSLAIILSDSTPCEARSGTYLRGRSFLITRPAH